MEHLSRFEIQSPVVGAPCDGYVLHLIGRAAGRDAAAVAVEISVNDRLLRTVPVGGSPDEPAGAGPPSGGAVHALVGLIGLKRDARLGLRVRLADGRRVECGSIGVARQRLDSGYEPDLAPLMVTTLGRSGSTWLMQLLAAHPQIVIDRRFPYESTPAKYWVHMLRVLAEPANVVESAHTDTFHNDIWWVGNNPYHDGLLYERPPLADWFGRTYPERLAAFCQQQIDDWYLTLARTQGQDGPVLFGEKHMWPNYIPVLTWELYPRAKEVFLVRDFRDMTRSILAFDRQRGFAGFGRPAGASEEDYMRGVLHRMARDLQRSWHSRRDRAHLVRYEDLILEPAKTVRALLEYLEVDNSTDTVATVLQRGSERVLALPGSAHEPPELEAHRTVVDSRATIGRWRRETGESFRKVSEEVFGEALSEFGYER